MKITVDWFLKKDNMKIVLVVVMSLVLIVVLKMRMSGGKDAEETFNAAETYKIAVGTSAPIQKRTRNDMASRRPGSIKTDIMKSPPFIKRDLFSYRSPGTDPTRSVGQMDEVDLDEVELELTATIIDDQGAIAIIGNEVLGIGEFINGYEVTDIKSDEVTLSNGGNKFILRIPRDQ